MYTIRYEFAGRVHCLKADSRSTACVTAEAISKAYDIKCEVWCGMKVEWTY